jgi:hypothetical protein
MKQSTPLLLLSFIGISALITLTACSKHNEIDGLNNNQNGIANRSLSQMGTLDFPNCVNIWDYSTGTFPWSVTYPCPANADQEAVNANDIKRQKRIDSIINANIFKYREQIFSPGAVSPCTEPLDNYSYIPLYGVSAVNNNINVLLAAFTGGGQPTVTVYVWQNGILGGGIFISLEQGSVVKTFGFYPNTAYSYPTTGCGVNGRTHNTNLAVQGEIRNNSELIYSVSISKVINSFQFQNLQMYLSNTGNPNFYNYSLNSFNEVHYALGALNTIGITTTYQNIGGANNYQYPTTPYQLGQNLKTLTAPPGTTINLNGGVTPGVSDITE